MVVSPTVVLLCKGAAVGVGLVLLRRWVTSRWGKFTKVVKIEDKIIVLTGATSGIGRATAKELAKRAASGSRLILACRDLDRAEDYAQELNRSYPLCNVLAWKLDLSDFDSIDSFCRQAKSSLPRVDLLILNAGVAFCPYMLTTQGLEIQMGVNHFGHCRLTFGLLSLLKKGSETRVVQVSSALYKHARLPERLNAITGEARVQDLCQTKADYATRTAYADSKLAGMLFMKEMSRRYPSIGWYSVSPGIVKTNLGRHSSIIRKIVFMPLFIPFALVAVRSPLQGCQTVLHATLDDEIGKDFAYFRDCKAQSVSTLMLNCSLSEKLFTATQEIINQCDNDG